MKMTTIALVALTLSCSGAQPATPGQPCSSAACPQGEICQNDSCAPCGDDATCAADVLYGPGARCERGRCVAAAGCEAGQPGCRCTAEGECISDGVCREGRCTTPCGAEQVWRDNACVDATGCELCTLQHRVCGDDHLSTCGACTDGYVAENESCRATPTCAIGAPGSIATDCATLSRTCVEGGDGAGCGGCLDGKVDVEGTCVDAVTCEQLACEAENRRCEAAPNGHCTGCIDGTIENAEDGQCRAIKTCKSDPCGAAQVCIEASASSDRVCASGSDTCPQNTVRHRDGISCIACPSCANVEGSTGEHEAEAFNGVECVCQAAPGYFLLPGQNGGGTKLVACDADGDGWSRDNLLALQDYANDDIVVRNNTCSVQGVVGVQYLDEYGNQVGDIEPLDTVILLLESTRNDSQSQLDFLADNPEHPSHLPPIGGVAVKAQQLNALAKYCASVKADFNDNGVPDIQERHEDNSPEYVAWLRSRSQVAVALRNYTYFAELYVSRFTPHSLPLCSDGAPPGSNLECGYLTLQERSRAADANPSEAVGITVYSDPNTQEVETAEDGTAGNNHWRTCYRFTDSDYIARKNSPIPHPQYGMDFGRLGLPASQVPPNVYAAPPRRSFGHFSQFKCLAFDSAPAPEDDHLAGAGDLDDWILNDCQAESSDEKNLAFRCQATETKAPADGWVGWAISDFVESPLAYKHGCVDEYDFFRAGCPGFSDETKEVIQGDGDPHNHGNLLCGCSAAHSGSVCAMSCPVPHLLLHPDYDRLGASALYPIALRPLWMCGDFEGSLNPANGLFSGANMKVSGSFGPAEVLRGRLGVQPVELRGGYLLDYLSSQR